VILFDFVDGIEDVSSELPVDDRPGVPPLFAIGEKVTSLRTFRCAAFLELTKVFAAFVICSTNSAFIICLKLGSLIRMNFSLCRNPGFGYRGSRSGPSGNEVLGSDLF
jgi:hypothetical protein